MAYSTVHTGPNTQLGGLNHGRASPAYQVGMASTVKTAPMMPVASHASTKAVAITRSFRSIADHRSM